MTFTLFFAGKRKERGRYFFGLFRTLYLIFSKITRNPRRYIFADHWPYASVHVRIPLCSCACTIVQGSAILGRSPLLRMPVPRPPTQPLSDCEITTLSRLLFALPEYDSLCFRQFLLPPPTPLCILLRLQINNNKFGKGLSYSVTVHSTGPLLRLWVAPRLTAYHTRSPGPPLGL